MIFRFLGIFSIFFLMYSCQEDGLAGEIKSLNNQAKECLTELQEIDYSDLNENQKIAQELNRQLLPYFSQLDKASLKTLVGLTNAEKWHKKMHLNPDGLTKNLQFSVDQLSALYVEFKNDSIDKALAREYLIEEKRIFEELNTRASLAKNNINTLKERYTNLIPKAKHLADSINSK